MNPIAFRRVKPADTGFSHTVIEMFMVEANEAVSRALTEAGLDHLRRVHPEPDPTAVEGLGVLAPALGRPPPASLSRASIRSLLDAARGRPAERAVNFVLLRTLAQAVYSPSPLGHFALASDDYCHFTSPIRRYPDLTVHRLFDALVGGRPPRRHRADVVTPPVEELAELGRAASATERRAQQAERSAAASLLLLLMQGKMGETFDGVVTGVLPFGAFVQVHPSLAEGVVRVSNFGRDDWLYDRRAGTFVGRRTRRTVHLGLPVRVRVAAVDLPRQELVLVPEPAGVFGASPPAAASPASVRRPRKSDAHGGSRRGPRGAARQKKRGHQGP